MQISQLVTVRRGRWRIDDIRTYEDCRLVTLTGVAPPDTGVRRQLLTPFDTIDPIDRPRRPRFVSARLWRRACRALIAADTPPGGLRAVRHARIEVMPHQLEPALAILRGLGCRLLLADDVGLGKTIQAGIAIAELIARGAVDRVLVLTPSGLREQWATELSTRFGIAARVADASTLRRRAAGMPVGANPWSAERVAIASIDYVKRGEVLPAVAATPWDILIVDEAHGAAGDSDRRAAVAALASQASYVLLLTATPHNGDRQSFISLTSLGELDRDPLIVFRRTRADVRSGARRRIHALRVRPTAAEARMHALLASYTRALQAERDGAWLAASVLHKRALSSAWSLAQSIERRLDSLIRADITHGDAGGEQLALPLCDRDGELSAADEAPAWPAGLGLTDAGREIQLLRELLSSARLAARTESKLHAIRRLLRRSNEPAIVFTEYRDTLLHLDHLLGRPAAVLHGGLTRDERTAALDDFSQRRRRVLLATDAAGEGLNLHHTCRLVINLELPWNPMRLEQRIGRVDRIGQERVVHAWHLIAAQTGEARIQERLKDRIAQARADIGAPDPFGADAERTIARLVVCGPTDKAASASFAGADPCVRPGADPSTLVLSHVEGRALRTGSWVGPDNAVDCSAADVTKQEAEVEARQLVFARALTHSDDDDALARAEGDGPWIIRARRSALRAALGHRVLLVWRISYEDACGRLVESVGVPTFVELTRSPGILHRGSIEDLLRRIDRDVNSRLRAAAAPLRETIERTNGAFISMRLTRERAIAARRATTVSADFQPGLFDRRAERSHLIAIAAREFVDRDHANRIERWSSGATTSTGTPRLMLAVVP